MKSFNLRGLSLVTIFSFVLIVSFQNCSNSQFKGQFKGQENFESNIDLIDLSKITLNEVSINNNNGDILLSGKNELLKLTKQNSLKILYIKQQVEFDFYDIEVNPNNQDIFTILRKNGIFSGVIKINNGIGSNLISFSNNGILQFQNKLYSNFTLDSINLRNVVLVRENDIPFLRFAMNRSGYYWLNLSNGDLTSDTQIACLLNKCEADANYYMNLIFTFRNQYNLSNDLYLIDVSDSNCIVVNNQDTNKSNKICLREWNEP